MDINCDMGESFGRYALGSDAELLPLVTSVNIACGLHAGDPPGMAATVRAAKLAGTAIGVHPGYPDLQGFGRRALDLPPDEAEAFVLYQIGALSAFARAEGAELRHVKPHGALYNQAAKNRPLAEAIARAVKRFDPTLILVGLAGSLLIQAGAEAGLRTANEGFPERGYNPDGSLMDRRLPGALIHDPAQAAAQALVLAREGILTPAGRVRIDTLCIHGDSPGALEITQAVRQKLLDEHIEIRAL